MLRLRRVRLPGRAPRPGEVAVGATRRRPQFSGAEGRGPRVPRDWWNHARSGTPVGVLAEDCASVQRIPASHSSLSSCHLERRWPQEHFAALSQWLLENQPRALVFLGTQAERSYVAEVIRRIGDSQRALNIAGRTNVGCLLGVLARARIVITNDTGPMHMAAALGRPTVAFFGPETPERYGPVGDGHVILRAPVACAPCLSDRNMKTAPCRGDNLCMRQVPVADAVAAVQRYV